MHVIFYYIKMNFIQMNIHCIWSLKIFGIFYLLHVKFIGCRGWDRCLAYWSRLDHRSRHGKTTGSLYYYHNGAFTRAFARQQVYCAITKAFAIQIHCIIAMILAKQQVYCTITREQVYCAITRRYYEAFAHQQVYCIITSNSDSLYYHYDFGEATALLCYYEGFCTSVGSLYYYHDAFL